MNVVPIGRKEFNTILEDIKVPSFFDIDSIYEIYESVCEAIEDVSKLSVLNQFTPVNHVVLILYLINEYSFVVRTKDKNIEINDEIFNKIASNCADKYITNEQLNYKSTAFLNRFTPPISTIELYLNFALRTLEYKQIDKKDSAGNLIKDMLIKAFKMSKCIASLLIDGFETEAFSTWRTLHENECILICLTKYPDSLFPEYFKHITYALAYRGQVKTKEETDKIFEQIKGEMREHDLKSKDMKKFIEYGYLFKVPNLTFITDFKLNFRDGVEKIAGLSQYSKVYETASEIAHSSPLLLFSRRDYFFSLTLLNLYESFFRLETIFRMFYEQQNSQEEIDKYENLRKVYLDELVNIYGSMRNDFLARFKVAESNEEQNKEEN